MKRFLRMTQTCLLAACLATVQVPCKAAEDRESPSRSEDPRQTALRNSKADESLRVSDEVAFFGLLDLERPELATVREAVKRQDWPAAKIAWAKHLDEHLAARWVWSYRDRKKISEFLGKQGVTMASMAAGADGVLQRKFNFLGVPRQLGRDIVWESSAYDYEWCNVLNRHDYWKTLGYAWWQTGDPKYVEDWLLMLRDWLADNPVGKGHPWRSLEVGNRASKWFDIMFLFMDAPGFDASMKYEMTRSLVEHARFLHKNNARFKKGNWQTMECTGLASVGIMLPEFKESQQWRDRAFEKMGQHMRDGVYPDGAQYELTPGYHRHVMMQFLHLQQLAKKNGYHLPDVAERHEKMFEFLMQISTPDQRAVSHGDGGARGGKSIRNEMSLGALLYARPDMRYLGNDTINPDWIWRFSPEELAAYEKLPSAPPATFSHLLPQAQYAIMRTGWKKDDRWLFFDCGPFGGAHSHADQLQVLLYSGRDLVIDPGQISYDQPLSKTFFKSAQAHNGLLINEQGPPRETNPVVVNWCVKDRIEFVSGRIAHNDVVHQRSVLFVKPDYWVVVDHVTGNGTPTLTRLFQLPDAAIEEHSVRTNFPDGDNLWIHDPQNATIEMRPAPVLPNHQPASPPAVAFVTKQTLPSALATVLFPFREKKEIPKVELLPGDAPGIVVLRLSFQNGRTDLIAVASQEQDLKAGEHKGRGVALWVRTDSTGTVKDTIPPKQ